MIRRFFAAVSPYGAVREPGRGAAWPGCATRRAARRHAAWSMRCTRRRGRAVMDAVGFDWYDPVASHAMRVPGRRTRRARGTGRSDGPTGTSTHPAALRAWCLTESALRPGLRCGSWRTAWRRGRSTGAPSARGRDGPAPLRARAPRRGGRRRGGGAPVTAYFHWSLMDDYEWGTYEPRYGIFGVERSDPPRCTSWTPMPRRRRRGGFARVVTGLRAGDRVLGGP